MLEKLLPNGTSKGCGMPVYAAVANELEVVVDKVPVDVGVVTVVWL